jgi:hypothetical protein
MKDVTITKKRFFRFLKEMGVYSRCIEIYKEHKGLLRYRLFLDYDPYFWIQNPSMFCGWCSTKEGDMFWWAISLLWQYECYINGYVNGYNELKLPENIMKDLSDFFEYFNIFSKGFRTSVSSEKLYELKEKLVDINNKLKNK